MPHPMSYLRDFGQRAHWEVQLTWGLFIISIAVVLIITVLVVVGVGQRRVTLPIGIGGQIPVARGGNGLRWIYFGVGISTLVLIASLLWTMLTLAAINHPSEAPTLNIHITAQQWWWKAEYLSDDPSQIVVTANEIHIPVGQTIRIKLNSMDVIHSFWIPSLGGKTDVIPG
ncbi:MAG: cytochrome C, partial [Deltaproteobacteria bacterium]|nr:cytochrome C [Deltaproteobacteria bacterium]